MRPSLIALAVLGLSAALAGSAAAQAKDAKASPRPAAAKSSSAAKPSAGPPLKPSPKRPTAKVRPKAAPGSTSTASSTTAAKPKKQASRAASTKKPVRKPAASKAYTAMAHGWHLRPDEAAPLTPEGRPMLVLESVNSGKRVELRPERDDGGFSASELERAARFLADRRTGGSFPTDPRLLDLVYRVARHFDAPVIRVISGYRMPHGHSKSNHGHGRAIDIVVPGASDDEVASFARGLGFVGVGIYPSSGFIHIDTRSKSYFWVDRSGPGRRNRTVGILAQLAAEADAKALTRGEKRPLPFSSPGSDCTLAGQAFFDRAGDDDEHDDDREAQLED